MITITGWTWEYIGENMTIPRVLTLSKYWQDHPPVHHLVAAFIGYKGKGETQAIPSPPQDNDRKKELFFAEFQGSGGQVILS